MIESSVIFAEGDGIQLATSHHINTLLILRSKAPEVFPAIGAGSNVLAIDAELQNLSQLSALAFLLPGCRQ